MNILKKFQEIHLKGGFPNQTKVLILSFWTNVCKGVNNYSIVPFQVGVPCWWAKQREMQKEKKITIIINQNGTLHLIPIKRNHTTQQLAAFDQG